MTDNIPKPDRKDLHRGIREIAKLSSKDEPTGYISKEEMVELLIYLRHVQQLLNKRTDENI